MGGGMSSYGACCLMGHVILWGMSSYGAYCLGAFRLWAYRLWGMSSRGMSSHGASRLRRHIVYGAYCLGAFRLGAYRLGACRLTTLFQGENRIRSWPKIFSKISSA